MYLNFVLVLVLDLYLHLPDTRATGVAFACFFVVGQSMVWRVVVWRFLIGNH